MTLAEVLRQERKNKKWSRHKLASMIRLKFISMPNECKRKVSVAAIKRIELGKVERPHQSTLYTLSIFFPPISAFISQNNGAFQSQMTHSIN